jgi:diguanylate cyclase (GGDEF)-like protein
VLSTLDGSTFALIVGASYPVADLVLAALIVAIVTLKGGRPGSTWLWLGAGVVTFAVADTQYLYRVADGSYTVGTPLDGLWAVGLNLMAVAAVLPYHPGGLRSAQTPKALVRPNIFSFVGVGVLVFGSLSHHRLPVYAVILTTVTLLTAVQRTAVGFSALRLLAVSQLQARTDELTQLPNRRHFDGQVQRILATRKPGEDLAMMMVDLDGFKAINDSFGHHAGDELLRQIGPRLRRELRTGDLLARLGGDEFGVLLRDSDRAQAFAIATRVAAGIAQPFLIDGVFQTATASIGIALCPDDGADLAVLLQRADAAMFDAKFRGAGVMNYEPQLHNRDHDRLNVRGALEQRELIVDYQPQFALSDGRMVAVEALVRWRHPVRGLLMPNDFLAFFEQAGLMAELTLQVLEIGARDCRQWHLDGTDLQLSVNLAPSALLQDDLVEAISDVLDRHGRTPASLTLEITENVLVMGFERSLETLTRLRALGIQLSLDDYGTGYCSLTYLRDLPVNEVKIDRSFVLTLCPGSTDAAIVASTVQLVRALGLRTVAEGVETPLALSTLRELGCDVVQGFLLGRPMPASQVLRSGKPSSMDRAGAEIRSG